MQLARHAVHCRMSLLVIHHHVMTLLTLPTFVQSSHKVCCETSRLSSDNRSSPSHSIIERSTNILYEPPFPQLPVDSYRLENVWASLTMSTLFLYDFPPSYNQPPDIHSWFHFHRQDQYDYTVLNISYKQCFTMSLFSTSTLILIYIIYRLFPPKTSHQPATNSWATIGILSFPLHTRFIQSLVRPT